MLSFQSVREKNPTLPADCFDKRAALVVAHPGHELRVFGWLHLAQPRVFILTDGSGRSGKSRLAATTRIVEEAGAKPGCIYGCFTDRELYAAIINGEYHLFTGLAEQLAEALQDEQIDYVVGDRVEGYNPAHDVCRLVIDAALEMVGKRTGRSVANFDISLANGFADCPEAARVDAVRVDAVVLNLEETMLSRKLEAVRGYTELAAEVERVFKDEGIESLRTECLRRAADLRLGEQPLSEPPYYERHGEEQVAAGYYKEVLQYRKHVLPLAGALRVHFGSAD
jgi:hypothetical protein